MTRRAAIAALALAALFAAVGARDARGEWVTEVVTNDIKTAYVQNGLVTFFDIDSVDGENWVNLKSEGDNIYIGGGIASVEDSSVVFNRGGVSSNCFTALSLNANTIETVSRLDSSATTGQIAYDKQYIIYGNRSAFSWDARNQLSFWTYTPASYTYFIASTTTYPFNDQKTLNSYSSVFRVAESISAVDAMRNGIGITMSSTWKPSSTTTLRNYLTVGNSSVKSHIKTIRIYNRALSTSERTANYNVDRRRFWNGEIYNVTTNRVYRAPAPMRSFDAQHPFNNAAARTRLGGTGSGEDGTTLRPSAHFDIKKNEEE